MNEFFTVGNDSYFMTHDMTHIVQRIRKVETEMEVSLTSYPEIQCQINILKLNGKGDP